MYTKEEAREKIKVLAENFEAKLDYIKNSGEYKEAQIEREFIQPLFEYLNWNITNEGIANPADREFIVQARTDYIWQAYSYSYSTQVRPQYERVDFEEFRFFDCTFPVKNHETLNNYCVTKSNKTSTSIESELRMIRSLEMKLDSLVYQLYELTPEEIKIVEGKD
ncbi:MAG: hypothetical protein H7A23_25395 [Leptospiraceae bacterium]|nr:hypothetical protein [Leptospiraceae bacterium]